MINSLPTFSDAARSDPSNRVDFNVRLRYAIPEGTDLWLAYKDPPD